MKLLKGKRLASALVPSPSSRFRPGALVEGRASVGSARRGKARGTLLPRSVTTLGGMRREGAEDRGQTEDAGVMVPSDPS